MTDLLEVCFKTKAGQFQAKQFLILLRQVQNIMQHSCYNERERERESGEGCAAVYSLRRHEGRVERNLDTLWGWGGGGDCIYTIQDIGMDVFPRIGSR